MSAAPTALRSALPALFHRLHNELLEEVLPAQPHNHLDDVIAKAKTDADGGIVLFCMGDYYAAFDNDAEVIARVIGVQIQTPVTSMLKRVAVAGAAARKQILLTASCLVRNLRLLRMDGEQDIWIYNSQARLERADDIGEIRSIHDYDHAISLNKN